LSVKVDVLQIISGIYKYRAGQLTWKGRNTLLMLVDILVSLLKRFVENKSVLFVVVTVLNCTTLIH